MASLTRHLAQHLARPVDEASRRRASLHLLDWLGCAFAGAFEPAGAILRAEAAEGAAGPASVVGGAPRDGPTATFANGGLGNVLEMDDIHRAAILHPGPVTIPAALATAEARGASPQNLLDAIVVGYEAVIRVGRSLGPGHYALWHNTASVGPFAAAAAAGHLLRLEEDSMVAALGNAGTQVSGPWQCRHEPVMTKQLHTARAAQAGLMAARLAARGFSGPAFILEGPQGLYAATAPDAVPEAVMAEPHGVPLIHEVSFKPWPACRHAHAAIDAALLLREALPDPGALARVEVRTYADAVRFCDRPEPTTVLEAKFSLQHAVALSLIDGPPDLAGFEPAAIARPEVTALRSRISVRTDSTFDDAYPGRYGTGLTAQLADGTERDIHVPDALGDPENPLSEEGLVQKARTLLAYAGAAGAADALIEATLHLPDAASLSDFGSALSEASARLTSSHDHRDRPLDAA